MSSRVQDPVPGPGGKGLGIPEARIDLHVHTTASDGTASPTEAVQLAAALGLQAIAITDHDTIDGYREAAEAGIRCGVEVVPGIEISTEANGKLHVLGYYIDPQSPAMVARLEKIVTDRDDRNRRIVDLMVADGLPVDYPSLQERFGGVIGRPHLAQVLVELGVVQDIPEAFARYVNRGGPYYLPRHFLSLEEACALIQSAGGVPVLAHPFQYRLDDEALRALLQRGKAAGLQGMECRYSGYSEEQSRYLEALAEEFGLRKTGGSDFHGERKKHIQLGSGTGDLQVPYRFLADLRGHG